MPNTEGPNQSQPDPNQGFSGASMPSGADLLRNISSEFIQPVLKQIQDPKSQQDNPHLLKNLGSLLGYIHEAFDDLVSQNPAFSSDTGLLKQYFDMMRPITSYLSEKFAADKPEAVRGFAARALAKSGIVEADLVDTAIEAINPRYTENHSYLRIQAFRFLRHQRLPELSAKQIKAIEANLNAGEEGNILISALALIGSIDKAPAELIPKITEVLKNAYTAGPPDVAEYAMALLLRVEPRLSNPNFWHPATRSENLKLLGLTEEDLPKDSSFEKFLTDWSKQQ